RGSFREASCSLPRALHMTHLARCCLPGDYDERIVQAGPLDAQCLDTRAALDERLEQRLRAAGGKLEPPFAADERGRIGKGGAPRPVRRPGTKMDDRAQPAARLIDIAF